MSKVIRVLIAIMGFVSGFILGAIAGTAIDFAYFPLPPNSMPIEGLASFFRILLSALAGSIVGLILGIWLPMLIKGRRTKSKELQHQEAVILPDNIWPPPPKA